MNEHVNHPAHYGGADNPYEAIKVIEAWQLDFNLGNTVKYISRAGKKFAALKLEDLKKAKWYLEREIESLTPDQPLIKAPGPAMRNEDDSFEASLVEYHKALKKFRESTKKHQKLECLPDVDEFLACAAPLMKYLCRKHHPHHVAIVEQTSATLLEQKIGTGNITDYLKD